MSVHTAITEHSRKQHEHLQIFRQLDGEREMLIQDAVDKCGRGEAFTTDAINRVTAKIIEHAKQGISPLRQYVTQEMVQDYVDRLKENQADS